MNDGVGVARHLCALQNSRKLSRSERFVHRIVIKTACKPFQIFQNQRLLERSRFPKHLEWFTSRFDYNSVHKALASAQFAGVLNWPF